MADNKIQIDITANDQASAKVEQLTAKTTALATALGTTIGYGLQGAVANLSRAMLEFAEIPFKVADGMAELARKGYEVKEVFSQLAEAQNESQRAWKNLSETLASSVAPGMITVTNAFTAFIEGYAKLLKTVEDFEMLLRRIATSTIGLSSGFQLGPGYQNPGATGPALMGPTATPEQLAEARRLRRMYEEQQREAAAEARRQRQFWQNYYSQSARGSYGPQTAEETLWGSEGIMGFRVPFAGIFGQQAQQGSQLEQAAVNAGQQVASGLTQVVAQFVTGMTSLGNALKAFFVQTVSSILATVAQLGIGIGLTSLAGGAGGFLGFLGKIGGKLLGASVGTPRGGNIVFQGLNTRDMYMAVTGNGSLARANDLQRMRTEVA